MADTKLIIKLNSIAFNKGFFGAIVTIEDGIVIMNIPHLSSIKRYYLGLSKSGLRYLAESLEKIG
jgi:hypothetical protein